MLSRLKGEFASVRERTRLFGTVAGERCCSIVML